MPQRTLVIRVLMPMALSAVCLPAVCAADWPAYRHDSQRTGVTAEQLRLPLNQQWVYYPPYLPNPAWPDPALENPYGGRKGRLFVPLMTFDRAHQLVASGGKIYFGSSADHKVYCLDAATVEIQWTFHTEAPVRFAPAIFNGRVYVGSDDGWVYCLDAKQGELKWKYRPGPSESRLPANQQISSRWPVRSGVVVDGNVAYFAAGIFPEREGCYLAAVDAADGKQIWKQTINHPAQGYMVASATQVYVPSGEGNVTVYDRRNGACLGNAGGPRGNFCTFSEDVFVTGPSWWGGQLAAIRPNQANGTHVAGFGGNRLVAKDKAFYVLSASELYSVSRLKLDLAVLDQRRKQLVEANKKLKADSPEAKKLEADLAAVESQRAEVEKAMNALPAWRVPSKHPHALILAGNVLFAGGDNEVAALNLADGKPLWTSKVDGRAYALAVADGRLLVGTDKAAIHCFANGPAVDKVVATTKEEPYPKDDLSDVYAAAAEKIAAGTPFRRGFALVLGCGEGRLAYEISKRVDMTIIGVDDDPKKVAAARAAIDKAGRYGGHVGIHKGPLNKLPYTKYLFNLIVSDRALANGALPPSAAEIYRVLRPCGGVAYIGQPGKQRQGRLTRAGLEGWLKAGKIEDAEVTESDDGLWAVIRRGKLPGAADWSHQYANLGNTTCSEDTAVKKPLQMQWYGRPGPRHMFDRHSFTTAPICVNGRMFTLGERVLFANDAYNGAELWFEELPELPLRVNIARDCGFLTADQKHVFVGAGDNCVCLDVNTGERRQPYPLPPHSEKKYKYDWGYVAIHGELLFGSGVRKGNFYRWGRGPWYDTNKEKVNSDFLFAVGKEDRKLHWKYDGVVINSTITVGGGRVYFLEQRDPQRVASESRLLHEWNNMAIVALDQKTGKKVWEIRPKDYGKLSPVFFFCYKDEILTVARMSNVYEIWAYHAADGKSLWFNTHRPTHYHHGGHRRKTVIVGQTLLQEPIAYDLRTGKQKWTIGIRHKCGALSASADYLFGRHGYHRIFDLGVLRGTRQGEAIESLTSVTRPGCWINIIAAGGLVLTPEASAGCQCGYPIRATMAFVAK